MQYSTQASHVFVSTIIGQLINSDNIYTIMSQQTVIQWRASEMDGKGNYIWWSISCTVSEWWYCHILDILGIEERFLKYTFKQKLCLLFFGINLLLGITVKICGFIISDLWSHFLSHSHSVAMQTLKSKLCSALVYQGWFLQILTEQEPRDDQA